MKKLINEKRFWIAVGERAQANPKLSSRSDIPSVVNDAVSDIVKQVNKEAFDLAGSEGVNKLAESLLMYF
jgi:hypothetical protein